MLECFIVQTKQKLLATLCMNTRKPLAIHTRSLFSSVNSCLVPHAISLHVLYISCVWYYSYHTI